MELKVTTKRVLAYEEKTGKDLFEFLKTVEETDKIKVRDLVELFEICGEGYTVDVYDAWEATFIDKCEAIFNAIGKYFGTDKVENKKSKK